MSKDLIYPAYLFQRTLQTLFEQIPPKILNGIAKDFCVLNPPRSHQVAGSFSVAPPYLGNCPEGEASFDLQDGYLTRSMAIFGHASLQRAPEAKSRSRPLEIRL